MSELPIVTLQRGQRYFSIGGRQKFVFSRNLTGVEKEDFWKLLDLMTFDGWLMQYSGTRVARVNVEVQGMRWKDANGTESTYGYDSEGNLIADWDDHWKSLFQHAATFSGNGNSIYFLPVFTGWYNWNGYSGNNWDKNPLNKVNGGPASQGSELFTSQSTWEPWLKWLESVVKSWGAFRNIFAWEIYSEVNLTQNVIPAAALTFIEKAADAIHGTDPLKRPVTVSLAGRHPDWPTPVSPGKWKTDPLWGGLFASQKIDFIQIHPYPDPHQDLGKQVIEEVADLTKAYSKPVMIGESGLNGRDIDSPLGVGMLANAHLGLEHAVWSGVMSGALNARAFWGEDSYALYIKTLGWDFLQKYSEIERAAARFMYEIDPCGLKPVQMDVLPDADGVLKVTGAALAGDNLLIGWVRDAGCEPPNWHLEPQINGVQLTIHLRASFPDQTIIVDYHDTTDGLTYGWLNEKVHLNGQSITLHLPAFTNGIAFKARLEPYTLPEPEDPGLPGYERPVPREDLPASLDEALRSPRRALPGRFPALRKT